MHVTQHYKTPLKLAIWPFFVTFKILHGYPKETKGNAGLRIAANWLDDRFRTLLFTIEMPFKDNTDLPSPVTGWSAERSAQQDNDVLFPIQETLKKS